MAALEHAVTRITADLTDIGVRFALVGGLAVSARSDPRLTRDADLAVSAEDVGAAEALVRQLTMRGYRTDMLVEQEHTGRFATVRVQHSEDGGLVSDLLFASSGIEH